MLLSRKKRFIFIHIYKNAGTSITSALLPFTASKGQRGINRILRKLNLSAFDHRPYPTHSTASEIIKQMGQDAFDSYFSFAFVRNPWDWQVSLYSYMLKNTAQVQHELVKSFGNFDTYIRWRCAEEVRFQKDFVYSENGELLVNFVGRFENLERDFQYICSHIGISALLPRQNVSNMKPYQQYYTDETRELVRQAFEPDIALFQYAF